jgi:hypothetical protein
MSSSRSWIFSTLRDEIVERHVRFQLSEAALDGQLPDAGGAQMQLVRAGAQGGRGTGGDLPRLAHGPEKRVRVEQESHGW